MLTFVCLSIAFAWHAAQSGTRSEKLKGRRGHALVFGFGQKRRDGQERSTTAQALPGCFWLGGMAA